MHQFPGLRRWWLLVLPVLLLVGAACNKSSPKPTPSPSAAAPPAASPAQQAGPAPSTPTPRAGVPAACAWPVAVTAAAFSANPRLNVLNPDTAAAYFYMPVIVEDGLRVTLSGQYPDSRYLSLAVYDANGAAFASNGVSSTLTDYRIAPDSGSVNPWQQPAAPGGHYTVTLQADVAPNQVNTLPLAPTGTPAGAVATMLLRVYAAANNDAARAPLPTITSTLNGVSTQLPACPASSQAQIPASFCAIPWAATELPPCRAGSTGGPTASAASATATPAPTARPGSAGQLLPFARYPMGAGGTPDTDTGYLYGFFLPPQNGEVLVIHGQAPPTPSGADPHPWPALGTEVRYWSLCIDLEQSSLPVVINLLPDGTTDYGCRYDGQVALDGQGAYTFVVGTEAQRAAIAQLPGTTFLPVATAAPTQPYSLSLRNILADPAFAQAVQQVPADGKPASAAAAMGAYYPRAGFCSLATLASSGPTACVKSP